MNPQQPGAPLPPPNPDQPFAPQPQPEKVPQHAQYEFIMNPEQGYKRPRGSGGGGSTIKRAAVFGVGIVVLLVLVMAGKSVLSKGGTNYTSSITVAQDQAELLRVAGIGTTSLSYITNQTTLNLIYTIRLSVSTSQIQLLSYLSANGQKVDPKVLALRHSAATDSNLKTAQANSSFDSELVTTLQNDLTIYSRDLKAAYASNPGPKGQSLLKADYTGAQLLLAQSKQQ